MEAGVDEISVYIRAGREREVREAERDARLAAWIISPHLHKPLSAEDLLGTKQRDTDPIPQPNDYPTVKEFSIAVRAWRARRAGIRKPAKIERWRRWRTR